VAQAAVACVQFVVTLNQRHTGQLQPVPLKAAAILLCGPSMSLARICVGNRKRTARVAVRRVKNQSGEMVWAIAAAATSVHATNPICCTPGHASNAVRQHIHPIIAHHASSTISPTRR
jgi:hypothetical protein